MADFTLELLDLPASGGSSAIALAHLDDAAAAAARLSDDEDAEALHDFRVAIRRLRVTLRGYREIHDRLSRKQRSKLRKLAHHTNPARDAEVQIAWLRERKGSFSPAQREGLTRFRARLRARHRRRVTSTRRKLLRWFSKLERKVRARLGAVPPADGKRERPFRVVAAAAVVDQAQELGSRLESALTNPDPADVHATRIAAKRLRYLLEPLTPAVRGVDALVAQLQALQGELGTLTDGHELETALQDAGGKGTDAALSLLRRENETVLAKLRTQWPQAAPELARHVALIARQLQGTEPATPLPPPSMRAPARRSRRRATA